MKLDYKTVSLIVILLILGSFFVYKDYTFKNKIEAPVTLQKNAVTDIFFGSIESKTYNSTSQEEPGQRFTVKIKENPTYPQTGDATGIVTVNDSNNVYPSTVVGISKVFYTQYDVKNNWYTIIKVLDLPYSSGKDQ